MKPQKRRKRTPPYTKPFGKVEAPNQIWCIDFKGWFRTGDGNKVYPFTVTDAFSRFLLACEVVLEPKTDPVMSVMERLFREYGVPEAIRSDNGVPFATTSVGGLSELNIWWTKIGIRHERIEPGKPQQNGRHERMHLTLKQEVCRNPSTTPRGQQRLFDAFVRQFNFERPHEALNMKTPGDVYVPSSKLYSPHLIENGFPKFGLGYAYVDRMGKTTWNGHKIEIGRVLRNQIIDVEPLTKKKFVFRFGPHFLGTFDERKPTRNLIRKDSGKVSPMS